MLRCSMNIGVSLCAINTLHVGVRRDVTIPISLTYDSAFEKSKYELERIEDMKIDMSEIIARCSGVYIFELYFRNLPQRHVTRCSFFILFLSLLVIK